MDAEIKEGLAKIFIAERVEQIATFLNRGFDSQNAQIAISSIFIYAKDNGKSVTEVLAECEKEWTRNWNFQHPDIKGDPLAPGGAGKQNNASLLNIYRALGIPTPAEAEKAALEKIPKGEFVVKTMNSTYRFGKEESGGIRSVSTDSKLPLRFSRCKIMSLAISQSMEFENPDDPDRPYRRTSMVVSIEPGLG